MEYVVSTREVVAEMAGQVWKVLVEVGAEVEAGDPVAIVESMKMEFPAEAPVTGRVAELLCSEGDTINAGTVIASIRPMDSQSS